jgi:hypothetical protein
MQDKSTLGDRVESFTDKDSDANAEGSATAPAGPLQSSNRRRFSRNALASSAVLLSLGNRVAWGQTIDCMSVTTINSFNPATRPFASAPAGRPDHNENLAAEIHRIGLPPTYQGTDGTYSTCQDPDSLDGVCLVKGDCPP